MNAAAVTSAAGALDVAGTAGQPSSLFSSKEWLEVITATYGFEAQALCVGHSALLFSVVQDLRQQRLVSFPFSDYCDPLLADPSDWPELLDGLVAAGVPVHLRVLHARLPDDERFHVRPAGLWHAADLTSDPDHMWSSLPSAARQNVRRAERDGISIRVGTTIDDVELFHAMHRGLRRRRYKILAQPRLFFQLLYDTFVERGRGFVLLAESAGEPVAGLFLIESGGTLYYKFNASTERGSRPNDLLAWHAMTEGHERGLQTLDFGFSDLDQPGLHRFKRKFADREETIMAATHTPPDWNGDAGAAGTALLGRITDLFVDPLVPDTLAARAGDVMYRYFC